MVELLVFHNIATAFYKNIQFNKLFNSYKDFEVVHFAETEKRLKWDIDLSNNKYPFTVLNKGNLEDASLLKLIIRSIRIIKKKNPDIIYIGGYSNLCYWIILFYGKLKNKKIILEMNSIQSNSGFSIFKNFLKKIFIRKSDLVLTYSELSKENLIKLGIKPDKILMKPNITDHKWWSKETDKYKGSRESIRSEYGFCKKNLIFVGRFDREKNIKFLLNAFIQSFNNFGNIKNEWGLILVGEGPQRTEIRDIVDRSMLKNIFLLNFAQMDVLAKLYSVSDVLVLPSTKEPWGVVINEAVASGLAVFSSKYVGASGMLVREGVNGFMFDPEDEDSLIKLFDSVLNGDIDLNKLKQNSKIIIEEIDIESITNKIPEAINLVKN